MSCAGVLCHVLGCYVICWGTMSRAGVLCHLLAVPYSHTLVNHSGSVIDASASHLYQH